MSHLEHEPLTPGQLKKESSGAKTTRLRLQEGGLDFASWTLINACLERGTGDEGARERKRIGIKQRTMGLKKEEREREERISA